MVCDKHLERDVCLCSEELWELHRLGVISDSDTSTAFTCVIWRDFLQTHKSRIWKLIRSEYHLTHTTSLWLLLPQNTRQSETHFSVWHVCFWSQVTLLERNSSPRQQQRSNLNHCRDSLCFSSEQNRALSSVLHRHTHIEESYRMNNTGGI